MKRFKFFKRFFRITALLFTAVIACLFIGSISADRAYAQPNGYYYPDYYAYSFEFEAFKVKYDVHADRTMDVTMDLTVHYTGHSSTGFIHDIPVNAGDRVRHIRAYEVGADGKDGHLDYTIDHDEHNFVSVNMGDRSLKTDETHRYRIYYEYAITKPAEKNVLYLNAVGYGSEADINNVEVTYNLPASLKNAVYYTGISEGSDQPHTDFTLSDDGKTLTLYKQALYKYNGITFALTFDDGVLSTRADVTPYYVVIGGCVLLALLFAVKFLLFNKDGLTPVVNVEAPNDMDPLVMGKLIDNKVDQSDVTSLIFYWADKGHLKINLDNPNDVELIRISRKLPDGAPKHQRLMYDKLFKGSDVVRVKSLANSFYTTVDAVTKEVNAENGKLYDGKSMGAAVLFALIGGLLMALTPIILPIFLIGGSYRSIAPLFMVIPAFVVFAVAQSVRYNRLKNTKKKTALLYLFTVGLSAVFTVIYAVFIPSYIIEVVPKIVLCAVGFTIVILSTLIISRTEAYTEKLNHIVGFREFILNVEKEKLELMLEENPEFYYRVLPYAIVLGVSDIWADKFKSINIAPPSWTTRTYRDDVFDFMVFHTVVRSVNSNMVSNFTSRPSSNSLSGGGSHGGSFGGFSGGGHGGGGFRGR